jgi:uncharacterized ion transporter superfamily protein YfcC
MQVVLTIKRAEFPIGQQFEANSGYLFRVEYFTFITISASYFYCYTSNIYKSFNKSLD